MSSGPFIRVEDAGLVPDGGPARLVISRLTDPDRWRDALHAVGALAACTTEGRVRTIATIGQLADAATRAGPDGTEVVRRAEAAIAAWAAPAPDVPLRRGSLACSARPLIMGVLNVTPDSFSDGGSHYDPADHPGRAVRWGLRLIDAGADIIDVGGESTRPGAVPVPEDEELRRVVPVVEALAAAGAVVSVDTCKAAVARAAVEAGAALVNDVSAGALDGLMMPTVAELGVPYVAMHMRGTPRTMQRDPRYADVVAEVFDFLAETVARAEQLGIPRERIIVDPGIGFGKTVTHNLELLRALRQLKSLGRPVLIGTSRKSFLGQLTGIAEPQRRLIGSVVTAAYAITAGAAIVRVHDVPETVEAAAVAAALADHGGS